MNKHKECVYAELINNNIPEKDWREHLYKAQPTLPLSLWFLRHLKYDFEKTEKSYEHKHIEEKFSKFITDMSQTGE